MDDQLMSPCLLRMIYPKLPLYRVDLGTAWSNLILNIIFLTISEADSTLIHKLPQFKPRVDLGNCNFTTF